MPGGAPPEPATEEILSTIKHVSDYEYTRGLCAKLDERLRGALAGEADQIREARDIMFLAHFGQKPRSDGSPYINHPLEVAIAAIDRFHEEDPAAIIAALLHDTVEDQPERLIMLLGETLHGVQDLNEKALRLLGAHFSPRTSEIVSHLTNPDYDELATRAQLAGDPGSLPEVKRRLYREHFFAILDTDPQAFLIKLADFCDNALRVPFLPWSAQKQKLLAKYGPVLRELETRLGAMSGDELMPQSCRRHLLEELGRTLETGYPA